MESPEMLIWKYKEDMFLATFYGKLIYSEEFYFFKLMK